MRALSPDEEVRGLGGKTNNENVLCIISLLFINEQTYRSNVKTTLPVAWESFKKTGKNPDQIKTRTELRP